ncbi:radical SAM protein [Patescibacteria group bacterium]|nr:radical SAM protein [Patescibacteria group bacterium]MBU1758464.1 radical SAM protein [Patescibacteria group bacterium]
MDIKSYISSLKKLKKLKKFIPYFDIPFQHVSPSILKRMGRELKESVESYVYNIRKIFPKSYIRTNFIIGFPGETEKDHKRLLSLIKKGYFDNIALFEYHDESLATSSKLDKKVTDTTIRKRFTQTRQLVNQELLKKEKIRK